MTTTSAGAGARGQLYRFLAAAFMRPPTAELVAPLLDGEVVEELGERFGADAVAELVTFKKHFSGDWDALDREYQELFVVPLGHYVAPYEAVYRDERVIDGRAVRGLLMGPSTLAVQALYREAGFDVVEDLLELPDHVGLELAGMEALCKTEARAWEDDDAATARRARALERRLVEDHLRQWLPALAARIRAAAPGPFYRGIATLTEAFLRGEAEELAATRP